LDEGYKACLSSSLIIVCYSFLDGITESSTEPPTEPPATRRYSRWQQLVGQWL